MKKGFHIKDSIWNILTVLVVASIFGSIAAFVIVFIDPYSALNPLPPFDLLPGTQPLPPDDNPVQTQTSTATIRAQGLPPTWTLTPIPMTATPTNTLTPTNTATLEPTATPTITETPTQTPTRRRTATRTRTVTPTQVEVQPTNPPPPPPPPPTSPPPTSVPPTDTPVPPTEPPEAPPPF